MKRVAILTGILLGIMILATPVMAEENQQAEVSSAEAVQVSYHTHIQNIGWEWDWASGGDTSGTFGQGLRLEGIQIELTGDLPEGAKILYRTQIQNVGWEKTWTETGRTSGTVGQGLRLEGIQIKLENLPGYTIEYRTHVQNVGWEENWAQDGETAGTVGRGLRLEGIQIRLVKDEEANLTSYNALIKKVESLKSSQYSDYSWNRLQSVVTAYGVSPKSSPSDVAKALEKIQDAIDELEKLSSAVIFKSAGTYGSEYESLPLEINNNVIINTKNVILQNVEINGDLIIGEGVGAGDCTLINVSVSGITYVRGGGDDSIHIDGGDYNEIIIQKTSSGSVRIVTNVDDMEVVIAEDADDDSVILEGDFLSVTVQALGVHLFINEDSYVDELTVERGALGSNIYLGYDAIIDEVYVNGLEVAMTGLGIINRAEVTTDNVTFERAPDILIVDDEVKITPTIPVMVDAIKVSGEYDVDVITTDKGTLQMEAVVEPEDASNQAVTWSIAGGTGSGTINSAGVLTATENGTVTVRATAKDGSRMYGETTITISNQTEPTIASASDIIAGTANQTVVVSLSADRFTTSANLATNWIVDFGTTGLTQYTITRDLNTQVTFTFPGSPNPGTILISAKAGALESGKISNTMGLVIDPIEVTKVTITPGEAIVMDINDAPIDLSYTTLPANASDPSVTWSSSNEAVVTVSETGEVSPVGEGTAFIIAKSTNNISDSVTVTVNENPFMTDVTAILDDGSDTEVSATGDPLSLTLDQNSVTKQIKVVMNESVQLIGTPLVYMELSGTDVEYGTVALDNTDTSGKTLIVTPAGSNGTAALLGDFTFKVAAGSVKDQLDNENDAVSFVLTVE
ncbi:Ig-like domain-containing protein [Eubacteriaceae bacterium ES2]|nr:Ig-like domain-containing protein [Eubacteriaceae bacterium ES2]